MHLLLPLVTLTALRVAGPLTPRNANYQIHAKLDEKDKVVSATEHLTWKNTASGAADSLAFHLYMNAFKNNQSTFMRESHGAHRGQKSEKSGWGAIDVKKIVVGGVDMTKQFAVDDTVGTIKLAQPIAAGASVDIDVDFVVKLPRVFARTGYHDDFFAVGQWFPKVGVFDCDAGPHGHPATCRWRAHQHHVNSEFFADYGVYDVDVPEGAEGAGGMEYPTLFFTEDGPVPEWIHLPEEVTIHELAHQYFYGLVGSDEVEEAWLDEGFTETMTDWGVSRMFGKE